ncbi:MAG: DUF1446 domain-containing protein [Actinobacteria bacterium]|nr:DUF1446 domain-containing protein [Actinomycetota bacterium]
MTDWRDGRRPVRIANCSGFLGDRHSAAREMVEGGPIDVLTGDWLAELTMLILAKQRFKHGEGAGYARPFVSQMAEVMGSCLEQDIRVVSNAGGLDPAGLADALREVAAQQGLSPKIAVITGDDLMPRLSEFGDLRNLDTGELLSASGVAPLTANAYYGGRPIAEALTAGADIVITGRATDAALVMGAAAWWHSWDFAQDLEPLAGSLVAGHVIECGVQATGGNYSFFTDVPDLEEAGFPIAEVAADGTSVITKHTDTGGMVSIGTVTAQLLYEIGGPTYVNPDVCADFGSIRLEQVGKDRVRISGVRAIAPPDSLKVSLNHLGGSRNTLTLVLTGMDVAEKADLALRTTLGVGLSDIGLPSQELAAASKLDVADLRVDLLRGDRPDPRDYAEAISYLRISVRDPDAKKVGKPFTAAIIEAGLASYPGLSATAPPGPATPYAVFWPTTVPASMVTLTVTIDGESFEVPALSPAAQGPVAADQERSARIVAEIAGQRPQPALQGATRVPLGYLVGGRSGDKAGKANVGLWVPDPVELEAVALAEGLTDTLVTRAMSGRDDTTEMWEGDYPLGSDAADDERADETFSWVLDLVDSPEKVHSLLPDSAGHEIEIHPLPNLRAVNLVIHGYLGRGVSQNLSLDPQAKGLAELLRARHVLVPTDAFSESAISVRSQT